jgi:hypothetical protein
MKKPEPGSLPENLKCEECGHTERVKFHCGAPMHIESDQLVCWMGSDCGHVNLPTHHEKHMILVR